MLGSGWRSSTTPSSATPTHGTSYLTDSRRGSESEHRSFESPSTRTESTSTEGAEAASLGLGAVTHAYKTLGGELVPALGIRVQRLDDSWLPETPALLDSGADVSTFPAEWAKRLGIKLDLSCCEEKKAKTAGGAVVVWAYPQGLRVHVEGVGHRLKADFCEGLDVPLLGRRDFFNAYRVTFDERAKTFTLEPYGPQLWSEKGP